MQDKLILPFYEFLAQAVLDKCPEDTQRILKTHLPLELIPPGVTSTVRNKIIMCLRNPKDACISYYKFTLGLDILTGPVYESLDDWIEMWLDGCVDYGDWCDLVLPYWEIRNQPNILIVTYEDILEKPGEVITQIAEFLGYMTSQDEVEDIKEKIRFDNMKKELLKTGAPQSANLMRVGKAGGHKGAFTARHHVLFNKKFREKMRGTGFDMYKF